MSALRAYPPSDTPWTLAGSVCRARLRSCECAAGRGCHGERQGTVCRGTRLPWGAAGDSLSPLSACHVVVQNNLGILVRADFVPCAVVTRV